ncbi:MAG: molybdopterin-dependent oxidoreductase [Rhodocyclales bacterium]|nr:molybdopterin-dependent oxidoreductase [Rhodocyclales bacterium]
MTISRRGFIKGAGALGGMAGMGVSLDMISLAAHAAQKGAPGKAVPALEVRKVRSGCSICPNFCGIEGTVVGGIVRTIYPDPDRADVYNHGICPKGAAGMYNTYDPYRLKKPLKRTNPKKGPNENPGWVEISWDEAFSLVAARMAKIKADNPSKLVIQYGQGKYLVGEAYMQALCDAFGTPNFVHRTTLCESARHVADDLTWGYHGHLPDLKYTNLLLNFGANYHEGEQTSRWLDWASAQGHERGMKTIAIDPRLSGVAAKAHEWVPVRPGKDVVMVLAMCKQLIDAGTIDEEFLVTYTNAPQLVGADGKIALDRDGKTPLVWDTVTNAASPYSANVKPALKGSYVIDGKAVRTAFTVFAESLADITPQYAEEVAGVPAATVSRLAATFAKEAHIGETKEIDGVKLRYRPVAAYTFRGLAAKEFGVQSSRSLLILNMLVGAIDAVGGLLLNHVYNKPSNMEVAKCEYPPTRSDMMNSVFHPNSHHNIGQQTHITLLDPQSWGLPYVPEMQIFYGTNRAFSTSNAWQQFAGLAKTFNVVIDIQMTETAWYSDVVLPDKTYLEVWHNCPAKTHPDMGGIVAIRQPMTDPFKLEHDAFSIFFELAKRVDIRDKYMEASNKRWGLKEIKFKPGRDYTPREAAEVIWADKAKKDFAYAMAHGFVAKQKNVHDKYQHGVDPVFKGAGKPKMKLYGDQLVATYEKVEKIAKANNLQRIDLAKYRIAYAPLPTKDHAFPTPHREAKDFPFYLITHKLMHRYQSGNTVNNAITNQALGADLDTNYVAINTATAKEMGIKSGDKVQIETRVGKVSGNAKVMQGVRPDTLAVSYHYGQWSPGQSPAAGKGTWINQVLELHPDIPSGMNSFNDTKCKLTKA